jgi:hypothetical protein
METVRNVGLKTMSRIDFLEVVAENSLIMEDICIELLSPPLSTLLAADEDLEKIIRIENF